MNWRDLQSYSLDGGMYTDESTLLQGSFKGNGLDSPGAKGRPMVEFYKHGNETSDYMKCGIFPH
jgi:hypothetical protein